MTHVSNLVEVYEKVITEKLFWIMWARLFGSFGLPFISLTSYKADLTSNKYSKYEYVKYEVKTDKYTKFVAVF